MYQAATPPLALFPDRFQCWPDETDPLYQDMDDPIPPEDRGEEPTAEIDADLIASRDPEDVDRSTRRMRAGTFNDWMRQTFMEEEAARKIQLFVRPRLPSGLSSGPSSDSEPEGEAALASDGSSKSHATTAAAAAAAMRQTDTTLSFASVEVEDEDDESDDEDHMQYDVFLWHGSYLGLEFYECNMTGYPCVEDANGNDSLPGMWNLRQGDYLVSINDHSTHHEEMPFESVMQILEDGVRPAILRFRRPRIQEVRYRSSLARLATPRRSSFNSAKKEIQRRRERLERSLCYVVWREEDGPLGIALKPERNKPYPTVSEVNPSGVVARESDRNPIRAGDLLLSINHMDVSAMGYRQSLEIMKFAPRPLVLTFRRSSPDYPVARSLEL